MSTQVNTCTKYKFENRHKLCSHDTASLDWLEKVGFNCQQLLPVPYHLGNGTEKLYLQSTCRKHSPFSSTNIPFIQNICWGEKNYTI